MWWSYQRPENALKRANEFIDVNKPSRALEVLIEVIRRGKMRTNYSEKLLEPIMFKYLELCVDLRKSHLAKEGLYQYRNIFQSVNVSSLETVVRYYLKMADERTESARKESHQSVVDIDDLDNLATPEEILLSAVSGEDAQDRRDKTILTPWVKFLWESYRQCLELLRTNSRVERLYHDIAKAAFKFCEKYTRKTEFRKLCENLRTHLGHMQKQKGSATAVDLNNPETQQMNLETRLEQLNYAIKMELWQEAYKAIEDISDLMNKSKKMPKPQVMASFYQRLSLVFWKAGNKLFHAAALFKYFQLIRDQKKNITNEELSRQASVVVIATLSIPLPSAHTKFDRFIETEKSALGKIDKLAQLLSLPKPPTRISLIKDLVRLNVLNSVPTELLNLFNLMEKEFAPLQLCSRMQGHLKWIREHSDTLPQYIPYLQEMTIMRLIKQVAQVYQAITFKRLLELCVFITPFRLERILVDLVKNNDLQISIDHRTECIHFGVDLSQSQREDLPEGPTLQTLPSETIRCQLVQMSSAMHACMALIAPTSKKKEMEPIKAQTIQLYKQTCARDHIKILQRRQIIEQRKEMLENQNLEKEELQRRTQEEALRRQKEEEEERLRREADKRELERQEEQLKQIQTKQIQDKLEQISKTSYGQKMIEKIDKEELLNLCAEDIMQRQVEELEKERKELQQRLKAQEKKVDHTERAKRIFEIPKMKKELDSRKEKDKEFWHTQEQERVNKMTEEHTIALSNSKRLSRMLSERGYFLNKLKSSRHSEIEKKLNDFNAKLEVERKNRLAERREQRRCDRLEAHMQKKAEEEQQKRDEEVKRKREDEERMLQEEEERERRKTFLQQEETNNRLNENLEEKTPPWRPTHASSLRDKEKEKHDSWRITDNSDKFVNKDIRPEYASKPKEDESRANSHRDEYATSDEESEGPPKWWIKKEQERKPRPPSPPPSVSRQKRVPNRYSFEGVGDRDTDRDDRSSSFTDKDGRRERGNYDRRDDGFDSYGRRNVRFGDKRSDNRYGDADRDRDRGFRRDDRRDGGGGMEGNWRESAADKDNAWRKGDSGDTFRRDDDRDRGGMIRKDFKRGDNMDRGGPTNWRSGPERPRNGPDSRDDRYSSSYDHEDRKGGGGMRRGGGDRDRDVGGGDRGGFFRRGGGFRRDDGGYNRDDDRSPRDEISGSWRNSKERSSDGLSDRLSPRANDPPLRDDRKESRKQMSKPDKDGWSKVNKK